MSLEQNSVACHILLLPPILDLPERDYQRILDAKDGIGRLIGIILEVEGTIDVCMSASFRRWRDYQDEFT